MPFGAPSSPSFADSLENGSNRPFAAIPGHPWYRRNAHDNGVQPLFGATPKQTFRRRATSTGVGGSAPTGCATGRTGVRAEADTEALGPVACSGHAERRKSRCDGRQDLSHAPAVGRHRAPTRVASGRTGVRLPKPASIARGNAFTTRSGSARLDTSSSMATFLRRAVVDNGDKAILFVSMSGYGLRSPRPG